MSTTVAPSAVPAVGSAAPDFTLPSTSGEQITLSELRGRPVLIAFFPLAFTSTCTAEVCGFSDDYAAYAEHDVVVLPTTPFTAPPISGLDAVTMAPLLTRLTAPFNLTGLPALSVPCGTSSEGLPIGLQIVAAPWAERRVLRAGRAYEEASSRVVAAARP